MDYKNTPEVRTVQSKYGKILHASRPEPPHNHPRMPMSNRAKIFSPSSLHHSDSWFLLVRRSSELLLETQHRILQLFLFFQLGCVRE